MRFSSPYVRHPEPLLVPHVEPYLRAFKVAIHGNYAIFPPLGVPSFSFCMCVVFSVKGVPVPKRFSWNDFPISVVLTRSRTKRLQEALRQLGLKEGGQAGADLGSEPRVIGLDDWGATRSRRCSCKNSRKEDLTWGSAPKCPTRLNQVRLGQRSRVR